MVRKKIAAETAKITVTIRKDQKEKLEKYRDETLKSQDEQIRESIDEYFEKRNKK